MQLPGKLSVSLLDLFLVRFLAYSEELIIVFCHDSVLLNPMSLLRSSVFGSFQDAFTIGILVSERAATRTGRSGLAWLMLCFPVTLVGGLIWRASHSITK